MAYIDFTARPLTGFSAPAAPAKPKWTWGDLYGQDITNPGTAAQETGIGQKLTNLPGLYQPQMRRLANDTKSILAGYGGVKWGVDDPNTPQDESLNVSYEKGHVGDVEAGAINRTRWGANARGMLYSSFTDQNVGDALNQVADQARGVIMQYGQGINTIVDNYFKEGSGLLDTLGGLYGQDASYYADPSAPWNNTGPATSVVPQAKTAAPKVLTSKIRNGRVAL